MDKIIIRNLIVSSILGVYPDERQRPQQIRINMDLFAPTATAATTDRVEDAVDYERVATLVVAHVEQARCFLVERLGEEICRLVFQEFGSVEKICLRVEKPGALTCAESVGIEITRDRRNLV